MRKRQARFLLRTRATFKTESLACVTIDSCTVLYPGMDSFFRRTASNSIAGTCGGVAICLVGHPFDTLKVRLDLGSASVCLFACLSLPYVRLSNNRPSVSSVPCTEFLS